MTLHAALHRFFAFVRHFFTSWNTTGEGIHSPYLFELVRFILRDTNPYYCFTDIERRRELLLACEDLLDVVDYGSQGTPDGLHISRRVCDIARQQLEIPKVGQMLFRLLVWMGQQEKRPLEVIELGSSLGVTTAYLAAANSRNHVTTYEGSAEVLRIAKGVWKALKLENIEWVEGNIDDTLYINKSAQSLDMAYIDANHTMDATLRYVHALLPRMTEKGVMVIDDIHYSNDMEKVWKALKADERVTTTMDLYHAGLLFIDPHYLKRNYIIRL